MTVVVKVKSVLSELFTMELLGTAEKKTKGGAYLGIAEAQKGSDV